MKKKILIGDKETNELWLPTELIDGGQDQQDFSELKKMLLEGITRPEIYRWSRKQGIPKREVNQYLETLNLVVEEDELFLDS